MVEIEGKSCTLFWDIDRDILPGLSFEGRARWLQERINEVLLEPLAHLESAYSPSLFVWLAVTELICAGIEAMGGFYGDQQHGSGTAFCRFVSKFMHDDFTQKRAHDAYGKDLSYAEHVEKYFRGGLAHGFKIEWGGLWMADDPACPRKGYLRPAPDGKGIAVCPRMLADDFRQAVARYFEQLVGQCDRENSVMGRNFLGRFEAIAQHRSQRP